MEPPPYASSFPTSSFTSETGTHEMNEPAVQHSFSQQSVPASNHDTDRKLNNIDATNGGRKPLAHDQDLNWSPDSL